MFVHFLTVIRPSEALSISNRSVLYPAVSKIKEVNWILACYSPAISSVPRTDKHMWSSIRPDWSKVAGLACAIKISCHWHSTLTWVSAFVLAWDRRKVWTAPCTGVHKVSSMEPCCHIIVNLYCLDKINSIFLIFCECREATQYVVVYCNSCNTSVAVYLPWFSSLTPCRFTVTERECQSSCAPHLGRFASTAKGLWVSVSLHGNTWQAITISASHSLSLIASLSCQRIHFVE